MKTLRWDSRTAALFAATLAVFLTAFTGSSVNIALPAVGRDFALDAILLSWVSTSFFLAAAIFLVPIGRFADHRLRPALTACRSQECQQNDGNYSVVPLSRRACKAKPPKNHIEFDCSNLDHGSRPPLVKRRFPTWTHQRPPPMGLRHYSDDRTNACPRTRLQGNSRPR